MRIILAVAHRGRNIALITEKHETLSKYVRDPHYILLLVNNSEKFTVLLLCNLVLHSH